MTLPIFVIGSILLIAAIQVVMLMKKMPRPTDVQKPKKKKTYTVEDANNIIEQFKTDDVPEASLSERVRVISQSQLFHCGKIRFGEQTVFDITRKEMKKYRGRLYYLICASDEGDFYISDGEGDKAVYLFTLDQNIRAHYPNTPLVPNDDKFHPWEAFVCIEDYLGQAYDELLDKLNARDKND